MNLNEFLMSDSDSSQDSLPPFTSFRKIGHLDETKDSVQKEGDTTAGSHPPPVPNLDLISGLSWRALLLSPSGKESSCSTDNASIHPKSSSYQVFDSDTDTTIPLPSTDDSSYTPFTSTKSEAEQRCLESPPPLRSAIAMKNPQHDLNGNPRFGGGQIAPEGGIYIPGIKVRREDSTSSDDSLPPFKYFRDEDNQMVPLGRTPSPPVNKENYLNALTDLGETISNLKIIEGSSTKKPSQVNKETQTESSEILKFNAGTQTHLQRDNTATQTYFQTSQTGTQTPASAVAMSTISEDDVSTQPEASSSAPYSLSPDDPLSYFSLPQTEFEARILHFKSQSQIFVCTKSTFAKLRALQVKIQSVAKQRRLLQLQLNLKPEDLVMFKSAEDTLWYRGIVTRVGTKTMSMFCPDYGFTEKVAKSWELIQPLFTNDLGMLKFCATPCETEEAVTLEDGATVMVRVLGVKQKVKYVIKVI